VKMISGAILILSAALMYVGKCYVHGQAIHGQAVARGGNYAHSLLAVFPPVAAWCLALFGIALIVWDMTSQARDRAGKQTPPR